MIYSNFWLFFCLFYFSFVSTDELNGQLQFKQNGARLLDENVARDQPVEQEIVLRDADYASIANASVIVHWFVDCNYVQRSKEFRSAHTFGEANRTHFIEALIEVTLEPEPAHTIPAIQSRLISDWQTMHQPKLPFVCHNKSGIVADSDKIYGYFAKNVTVFGIAETISCILSSLFLLCSSHIFVVAFTSFS